jgi:probable rRNA maturation factor
MRDEGDRAMRKRHRRAQARRLILASPARRTPRSLRRGPGEGSRGRRQSLARIEVALASAWWRTALPDAARHCRAAARAALAAAAGTASGPVELGIVLADDALVRSLNREWRGQNKPTNVLSFPTSGAPRARGAPMLLGDVVLAFETIAAEAKAQDRALADHLAHLVVHGVLHLMGFDHERVAEAERMEALEAAVLSRLGIADPYGAREAGDG